MKLKIHVGTVPLARHEVTAAILYLLTCAQAWSGIPTDLTWSIFEANMTEVYGKNFTEVTTPDITICVLIASRNPPANLACHKSSRCVFASVSLTLAWGRQTEGFTCWLDYDVTSSVCIFEEALVWENESVTIPDSACPHYHTFTCSKNGMIEQDVPPPRTTCSAPFTQQSFGCMYDDKNFNGTYCEARKHCRDLGANLASPETAEDCATMMDYYNGKYVYVLPERLLFYVGLFQVNGVWRWPANQRDPGPRGTGDWGEGQPDGGDESKSAVYRTNSGYKISDETMTLYAGALCHVCGVN